MNAIDQLRFGGNPELPRTFGSPEQPFITLPSMPSFRRHGRAPAAGASRPPSPVESGTPAADLPSSSAAIGREGLPLMANGAAIDAIAAERWRQIDELGHTPQADAARPYRFLDAEAHRNLNYAREDVHYKKGDWQAHARRHLARAGALVLAMHDWIEAGGTRE